MNSMVSQSSSDNYAGLILKRSFLAFIIILFFCDIAIYLSLAVSARLQPQYWIVLLVVLGAVLAWGSPRTRWDAFRTPLFFWCVLFLVLTLIFFVAIPSSHVEQLKERIRDVVLLTTFLSIFLMLNGELRFLRWMILLVVVGGAIVNFVGLIHNGFLVPHAITSGAYPPIYRPGGFYINPNESAAASLLGMILSFNLLRSAWREAYIVFILAAVAATFSREALLGWVVVTAFLAAFRLISIKLILAYLGLLVLCGVIVTLVVMNTHLMNDDLAGFYRYQVMRFNLNLKGVSQDPANMLRLAVLRLGWASFVAHPWIGNGIGFTYHWSLPVSTHNMYLLYMDDYGIIGLFLYPLLIWCMIRKAAGEARKIAWTIAIFLLFWGLFDHNVVQNYYSLFAISLTAAMSRISADEAAGEPAPIPAEAASG